MRGIRLYLRPLHAVAAYHEAHLMLGLMLILMTLLMVAMMRLRDCRIS